MLELFKNIGSKCRGAVKDSQKSTEAGFWGVDGNGVGDRLVQLGMAARRGGIDVPGLSLMTMGALFGAGVIGVVGLAFFASSGQDEAEIEEESRRLRTPFQAYAPDTQALMDKMIAEEAAGQRPSVVDSIRLQYKDNRDIERYNRKI